MARDDYDDQHDGWDDDRGDRDRDYGDDYGDDRAARTRVSTPGVFLIIVGVINLLGVLYFVVNTAFIASQTPEEQAKMNAEMMKALGGGGQAPPAQPKSVQIAINIGLLLANLAGSIFPILGGIRMRSLRSYGLAVTGAVVAMIPLVSCSFCLCFGGAIVGVWSLVVLMNPEVKSAFR
jgi:hypothetical protein